LMRAPYFGRYKDIVLILGGQGEPSRVSPH
jgi:hypothetical protein